MMISRMFSLMYVIFGMLQYIFRWIHSTFLSWI